MAQNPALDFDLPQSTPSGTHLSEVENVDVNDSWSENHAAVERWLHEVGGPIYDRMKADPSRAIPIEEVEIYLEERRRLRRQSS